MVAFKHRGGVRYDVLMVHDSPSRGENLLSPLGKSWVAEARSAEVDHVCNLNIFSQKIKRAHLSHCGTERVACGLDLVGWELRLEFFNFRDHLVTEQLHSLVKACVDLAVTLWPHIVRFKPRVKIYGPVFGGFSASEGNVDGLVGG